MKGIALGQPNARGHGAAGRQRRLRFKQQSLNLDSSLPVCLGPWVLFPKRRGRHGLLLLNRQRTVGFAGGLS